MEDTDIIKLRKILQNKKRGDLADLLKLSRSYVNESTRYGHYLYSTLSIFQVFSPLKQNEILSQLPSEDNNEIYKAVLLIYPHKEEAPEITSIAFYVDFKLDEIEFVETKALERIDFDYIHEQIRKCEDKITGVQFKLSHYNITTVIASEAKQSIVYYFWITSGLRPRNDGMRQFEMHPKNS